MHGLNIETAVGDCLTSPSSSYRVKKIIGSGAYGKVTLCQKASNNQMVALKVLTNPHDDYAGQKEARILQMLQEGDSGHDNIVRYMGSFQYEGHHCHEFEKLDIDMNDFLKSRPHMTLQLTEIRPIIAQMARALQYLKTKGIVHCDLKPVNIMMTDHIQQPLHVKLIDFGIACPVGEAEHGTLVQTLNYRAPEVQVGGAITEAIDIWSVGCIAAQMFLGTHLFATTNQYDLMRHVVRIVGQSRLIQRPFPLTIATENQDRRLFVDLLKHMLDLDPVSRYTPEDILNHPFITMSHLQHCFPLYYSKCQKIMDQVLNSSNEDEQPSTSSSTNQVSEAAVATQSQKSSRKRSREEEEEMPQKRLKKEYDTSRPREDTALQNRSRVETSLSQLRKEERSSGKQRASDGCEEHNPPLPPLRRSARIQARQSQSSRKRSREEEEEMPQKRLKKEDDTSAKSQREDDTSEERPREENTALQNRSRVETSLSQLRKEERSSGEQVMIVKSTIHLYLRYTDQRGFRRDSGHTG
uniref:Protein kinase domain-containing protein n=1 Tax=Neogobius melanostomus TaxID=47308 RepID=A0A8C6U5W4_9GOBI